MAESSRTMLACNGNFGRRNWKVETRRKYRGVNRVNSVRKCYERRFSIEEKDPFS